MNLKKYFPKDLAIFLLIMALVILIFSYFLLGITGARVVIGIFLVWLPFYIILCNFDLGLGEKFVFSLLLGLTLFPSITFLLGLIMSFRLAIALTFVLLIIIGMLIEKFKKK